MLRKLVCAIILIILSCNPIKTDKISLFNGISFQLKKGEKESAISSEVKRMYDSNFNNNPAIQIPLFKYIKNQNYSLFIGIPFNTNMAFISNRKINCDSTFYEATNDTLVCYKSFKRKSIYLAEYTALSNQNSLIYISALTTSKDVFDTLLTLKKLSERLVINL